MVHVTKPDAGIAVKLRSPWIVPLLRICDVAHHRLRLSHSRVAAGDMRSQLRNGKSGGRLPNIHLWLDRLVMG